jgi:hypothetical protein
MGSFQLNNELTFGDYGINEETCLFVYPPGEKKQILENATIKDVNMTSWTLFSKSTYKEMGRWRKW